MTAGARLGRLCCALFTSVAGALLVGMAALFVCPVVLLGWQILPHLVGIRSVTEDRPFVWLEPMVWLVPALALVGGLAGAFLAWRQLRTHRCAGRDALAGSQAN